MPRHLRLAHAIHAGTRNVSPAYTASKFGVVGFSRFSASLASRSACALASAADPKPLQRALLAYERKELLLE